MCADLSSGDVVADGRGCLQEEVSSDLGLGIDALESTGDDFGEGSCCSRCAGRPELGGWLRVFYAGEASQGLISETDLPEYEMFQKARDTEGLKSRICFELRLQARASRTILEYASGRRGVPVVCEADPWGKEEAEVGLRLLKALEAEASLRWSALKWTGCPTDKDAWLWGEQEPDLELKLAEAVEFVEKDNVDLARRCEGVKARLLGAVRIGEEKEAFVHLPAVHEALGCLIPGDLHRVWTRRRRRRTRRLLRRVLLCS